MKKTIAVNGLYYLFFNILNMIFPFLVSVYVTRIFTPSDIGEVGYARNIVSYFSVFAFLGIPTYGVREIAKKKRAIKTVE